MELGYQRWPVAPKPSSHGKPKLVFLHGMGGTGSLWRPVASSLENDFEILAPDQRAHGRSRAPQSSYTPTDFGQDLIDTLEATDFHPAWIVGHSMGVRSAVAAAHLRPEFAQGLILIDLGFSGPAGGGMGDGLAAFLSQLPLRFPSRAAARDHMNAHAPDPSMGQYLMAVATMEADGSLSFPFDRDGLIRTIEGVRDISVREWLRVLTARGMPVLALRGATSRVWSREDYLAEMRFFAKAPSIEFREIAETGHGLPFEKRLEFVGLLKDFVARHDKG